MDSRENSTDEFAFIKGYYSAICCVYTGETSHHLFHDNDEKSQFTSEECKSVTHIVVKSNINKIKDKEFSYYDSPYSSLLSISFTGNSVTLGEYSFYGSKTLTFANLRGVTQINGGAFCECPLLKDVELFDVTTKIGFGAFESCVALERIKIPASVNEIEKLAFSECKKLKCVEIDSNNLTIGEDVFDGCADLKFIVVPDSVKQELLNDSAKYGINGQVKIISKGQLEAFKNGSSFRSAIGAVPINNGKGIKFSARQATQEDHSSPATTAKVTAVTSMPLCILSKVTAQLTGDISQQELADIHDYIAYQKTTQKHGSDNSADGSSSVVKPG